MEFRKMRRAKQELSFEEDLAVIERATSGVFSTMGEGGYPYGVPLSFVYIPDEDGGLGKFYFHSAKEGHKVDSIKALDKGCFTIIDRDDVVSDEFTTYFKSVICFGHVRLIEDRDEMMEAITLLSKRYSPHESKAHRDAEIDREFAALAMIEFTVDHMTGKEAIELVRNREKYGK